MNKQKCNIPKWALSLTLESGPDHSLEYGLNKKINKTKVCWCCSLLMKWVSLRLLVIEFQVFVIAVVARHCFQVTWYVHVVYVMTCSSCQSWTVVNFTAVQLISRIGKTWVEYWTLWPKKQEIGGQSYVETASSAKPHSEVWHGHHLLFVCVLLKMPSFVSKGVYEGARAHWPVLFWQEEVDPAWIWFCITLGWNLVYGRYRNVAGMVTM